MILLSRVKRLFRCKGASQLQVLWSPFTLPHHSVQGIWSLTRRIPSLGALHDRNRRVEGETYRGAKSTKVTSVAAVDIPVRGANKHSKRPRVSPWPGSFERRSRAARTALAPLRPHRGARCVRKRRKGAALRIWQRLGDLLVAQAAKNRPFYKGSHNGLTAQFATRIDLRHTTPM